MTHHMARRSRGRRGASALLLLAGSFLLLGLAVIFGFTALLGPLLMMLPSFVLFYLVKQFKSARILTIPATMLLTVGLLLLAGNLTGYWAALSFGWALVFPGAFGLGLSVYGELTRNQTADRWGETMAKVGVGIFLIGIVLNALFGLGGLLTGLLGTALLPLLVVGGLLYLFYRNRRSKRHALPNSRYESLDDGSSRLDPSLWQEERERV